MLQGTVGLKGCVITTILLFGIDASAAVKNIRRASLPAYPPVQSAYDDIANIENMLQAWSPEWKYATPKDQVIARVNVSLRALEKAAEGLPDNEELQLFLGLVAHYSYNLDVQESYEVAVHSLEKAAKLAPQDYRPRWFLGNHQCQSLAIKAGMERYLAVERELPWDQLPPEFWDDYMNCAHLANMPAHVLRAVSRANKLDPKDAGARQFWVEVSQKRFKASTLTASYDSKDIWQADKESSGVRFLNLVLGMEFLVPGEWKVKFSNVDAGGGSAIVEAGPYKGKTGQVFPNLMVMAHAPKPGESLAAFLKAVMPGPSIRTTPPPVCPVQECLAAEGVVPGAYKAEGDGLATLVVFKHDEPEYPGLAFEEPADLPKTQDGGTHYFHPEERLRRLPGTLYYLVMLDTAESVKASGEQAYASLLKTMRVE